MDGEGEDLPGEIHAPCGDVTAEQHGALCYLESIRRSNACRLTLPRMNFQNWGQSIQLREQFLSKADLTSRGEEDNAF